MANWGAFSQGFASTFNPIFTGKMQAKQDQKTREQELQAKLAQMMFGAQLENQALTPEQKLLQTYQSNPDLFNQFQTARDPFKQQELGLQGRGLDIRQQEANTESAYKKFLQETKNPQLGTTRQKDYQFLMAIPGMTSEQALKLLFRPDILSQFGSLFNAQNGSQAGGGFVNGE